MSLLATASESMSPAAVAGIIAGVLAFTALLAGIMWRVARSVERAERDARYLRRWLVFFGVLYVFGMVAGISNVISGNAPPLSLLFLPIPLLIAWRFLRAAMRVKVPPK